MKTLGFVLVILTMGDGTVDYGLRVQSIRFHTRKAAMQAEEFLNKMRGYKYMKIIEETSE